jgi:hypothetical protein
MQNDRILFEGWRERNARLRYPFSDRVSLVNSDGVSIPTELFVDARIHPIGGEADMFISQISVDGTSITFTISGSGSGELCTGTYDGNDPADDIALSDAYGRTAGVLISSQEQLSSLVGAYGPGDYEFSLDQTQFAADVCIPMPQVGLTGFVLDDGNLVSGDIYLVGVDGVVLSVEDGYVRVDAAGDPHALIKACEEEGSPLPVFCGLKTINEILPNEDGDFKWSPGGNVAEDTVLRVAVSEGELRLEQVCSDRLGLSNG